MSNRELLNNYCLLWSPLPGITWFLPFIGHTGIADSNGTIYDFAGPYTINENNFAFGRPYKYILVNKSEFENSSSCNNYDKAIQAGNAAYSKRMHNLCCDNCHSHVAYCLNEMKYLKQDNWTMIHIWFMFLTKGKYYHKMDILYTYTPCIIVYGLILACFL